MIRHKFRAAGLGLCCAVAVATAACGGGGAGDDDGASGPTPPSPWDRPNVVLIMAEDIGPHLGAYGDPVAVTPTIDQLAEDGARYDLAFAPSGVCAPARTSLIMGTYPTAIGGQHMRTLDRDYDMVPPPEVKAYTEALRASGYHCTNNAKTDYQIGGVVGGPPTIWDESSAIADWRTRGAEQPFLSVFTFFTTHEGQLHDDPLPVPRPDVVLETPTDPDDVVVPPYYPDTPVVRDDFARYYDNIALLDYQVAEILDRLEEDGLADNTLVIFVGDNGAGFPRDKRWVYDGGMHVPLIVRFPDRVPRGAVLDELVSFLDFAPTLLSLAGVEVPSYMPGRVFLGPATSSEPEYVFAAADRHDEADDRIRAVRDERFKYIKNYRPDEPYGQEISYRRNLHTMQEILRLEAAGQLDGPAGWYFDLKPEEELYDTVSDPFEIDNLAGDPAFAEVLARMRVAHETWRAEHDDFGAVPEADMIEDFWPGGMQPVTLAPVVTPPGGEFTGPVNVTLSSETEGASIEYTFDRGPEPRWTLHAGDITVDQTRMLRARAVRYGYQTSDISEVEIVVR